MCQFFASGGWSIGVSAPASVHSMNIQDWFPVGLTGLISWQFKGLSRVFSNTKFKSIYSSVYTLYMILCIVSVQSVQSLSSVRLFATPWIAALQASLSITNSRSSLRLTSIESLMLSSHLILGHPLLLLPSVFPSIRPFSNESALPWGDQSTRASASASVLPVNIQDWLPSQLTGLISLQSKGFSRVFSNTKFKSINSSVLSFLYSPTVTSIHGYWKNHSFD